MQQPRRLPRRPRRLPPQTAKPLAISELEAHDVDVRLLGDVAVIHARTTTTFTTPTGQPASGLYTDVWAHVTRC